ncbi:hypothetical protein GH811_01235 [Acetobacterium malicum]|uniref:DUF4145 domain-containing protein n=1 Tax=Acetobacterium malicum TaxID=52692 RepID=A0ABR6YST9_9FIRM|nr:hypothetical protein [Acetobacterium malicum]MBC3898238.1 hypothetical protein [Acetobacterium malicum]
MKLIVVVVVGWKFLHNDVMPNDFLIYAEDELELLTKKSKINTISHLKRALDCQIDIFLESLHLKKIFDKNNLKFEQKTKFLADIGILSVTSINKLNLIRNKIEHEYIDPDIKDLQAYHDIVWFVIEILEAKLLLISACNEVYYMVDCGIRNYSCAIVYDIKNSGFKITIRDYSETEDLEEQIDIEVYLKNKGDESDFIQAFKFYLASINFNGFYDLDKYRDAISKQVHIDCTKL